MLVLAETMGAIFPQKVNFFKSSSGDRVAHRLQCELKPEKIPATYRLFTECHAAAIGRPTNLFLGSYFCAFYLNISVNNVPV